MIFLFWIKNLFVHKLKLIVELGGIKMELVVGSFEDYSAAYQAVINLKEVGLTADDISVVSKCTGGEDVEYGASKQFNYL